MKIKVEELCEYLPESSRGWKFIIHSGGPGVHSLTRGVRERLTYFFFFSIQVQAEKVACADFNEQSAFRWCLRIRRRKLMSGASCHAKPR